MKLLEVVEYVARKELAKSEQSTVSSESANAVRTTSNTPKKNAICWACQGKSHGQNTIKTRRDLCPAWNNECEKCSSKGHYTKCCSKCSSCSKWGHLNERSKKCQNNHSAKNAIEELDSIFISGMKTVPSIQLSDIKILRKNEHRGHHLAKIECNKRKSASPLSHKVYSKEHGWQAKRSLSQPLLSMTVIPIPEDHEGFGYPLKSTSKLKTSTHSVACADTGC